jgi:hypothetical protein
LYEVGRYDSDQTRFIVDNQGAQNCRAIVG